jgi:alkanesulfonate monooxygenase SsuD/methylene tetrahydromethanopterin reductase-like flavin-dependent oxidoreductase (luciferase family)
MKFGVFDHMDDAGVPLGQLFADRLKLIEAYDRAGIYGYHCAEHHSTPLGMSPSPSVYLAAIAQRTRRLRFGPLVYTLALYHPLRLAEEICMLDQMSRGRLMVGVGKGISPIEVGYYGYDYAKADRMFAEAMVVIRQALTQGKVDFEGEFYRFKDVPMVLKPVQKPHPPLWYGVTSPEASVWAAVERANIATLVPAHAARAIAERYRAEWAKLGHPQEPAPLVGLIRHVVLAETEAHARATAERAYRRWRRHMELLWVERGFTFPLVTLPQEIGPLLASGGAFAGTAEGARRYIGEQVETSGANYFICDITFGDITLDEAMRTVELLGREVVPLFIECQTLRV